MIMSQAILGRFSIVLFLCSPVLSLICKGLQPQQKHLSRKILLAFQAMGRNDTLAFKRKSQVFRQANTLLQRQVPCKKRAVLTGQDFEDILQSMVLSKLDYCNALYLGMAWVRVLQGHEDKFMLQCLQSEAFPGNIDFIYNTLEVESGLVILQEVIEKIIWFYQHHHLAGGDNESLEYFLTLLHHQSQDLNDCIRKGSGNSDLQQGMKEAVSEHFSSLEAASLDKENSLCARIISRRVVQKHLLYVAHILVWIRWMVLKNISVLQMIN